MTKPGNRTERAVSSMQWAAWADALGWISELTSAENLRRRTKGRPLVEPYSWTRQIGGRSGTRVDLPAGCYSDDTQLRLATARSITSHGFDVEAFARIELPVWQSYALGGGRATKAAAAGMSRQNVTWALNFYRGWESAGGNGAAMRIQPHVYAATDLLAFDHLDDVIKNAVVTHGHMNAIVGAVFHAVTVTVALAEGITPTPDHWPEMVDVTNRAFVAFDRCAELASYWRPQWEQATGLLLENAWSETLSDLQEMLEHSHDAYLELSRARHDQSGARYAYELLVMELGLADEATRGSGLATAVAAAILAAALPDHPAQAAQLAASRLNTDTDTIATMAAAIVGAINPRPLTSEVLDADHLASEARRLTQLAQKQHTSDFPYPDLLHWIPPKSALDSVGFVDGRPALAGLGWIVPVGETYSSGAGEWQWMQTSFGPTILAKYRSNLRKLPNGNRPLTPAPQPAVIAHSLPKVLARESDAALFELPGTTPAEGRDPFDVARVLKWLEDRGFQDRDLGYAVRRLIESSTHAEQTMFLDQLRQRMRLRMDRRQPK